MSSQQDLYPQKVNSLFFCQSGFATGVDEKERRVNFIQKHLTACIPTMLFSAIFPWCLDWKFYIYGITALTCIAIIFCMKKNIKANPNSSSFRCLSITLGIFQGLYCLAYCVIGFFVLFMSIVITLDDDKEKTEEKLFGNASPWSFLVSSLVMLFLLAALLFDICRIKAALKAHKEISSSTRPLINDASQEAYVVLNEDTNQSTGQYNQPSQQQ